MLCRKTCRAVLVFLVLIQPACTTDSNKHSPFDKILNITSQTIIEKKKSRTEPTPQEKTAYRKTLDDAFDRMFDFCKEKISGYEDTSTGLKWTGFGLAVIGALAGGVGVPALVAAAPVANKSAIAAVGGLSGVTNTAQGALAKEGLTSNQALETRKSVASSLQASFKKYSDLANNSELDFDHQFTQMKAAIDEARISCITYDITKVAPAVAAPGAGGAAPGTGGAAPGAGGAAPGTGGAAPGAGGAAPGTGGESVNR